MSKSVKFLWISDIHYKGNDNYKSKSDDDNFDDLIFKLVATKVEEAFKDNFEGQLYILLSGDIAFSAQNNQYLDLKSKLENCINHQYKAKTRAIICPGNHDVSWDNFHNLYANRLIEEKSERWAQIIIDYFGDKNKSFIKQKLQSNFNSYSSIFSINNLESHYKSKSDGLQSQFKNQEIFYLDEKKYIISDEYKETALEGFIIDKKNKIMFIVLNTAWYSIGSSLSNFIEYISPKNKKFKTPDIIKIINSSQEHGKSFTGLNHKESSKLSKTMIDTLTLGEYSNFFKICMMHHPLEWLDWNEKETYKIGSKGRENTTLTKILKKCDVILSGHIHPSRASRYEKLFNSSVIHLKGPLFLSHDTDDKEINSILPCNGFVSMELVSTDNDNNYINNLLIKYNNIETSSETGKTVYLASVEESEKFTFKKSKESEKKSIVHSSETINILINDIYNSDPIDLENFVKKVLFDPNIENDKINIDEKKEHTFFSYESQYFILQKDNYWLQPTDLYNFFKTCDDSIEYLRIVKQGSFLLDEMKPLLKEDEDISEEIVEELELTKEKFKKLNLILTRYNDNKLNVLRIIFFNSLDYYLSKIKTVKDEHEQNFLNYLIDNCSTDEVENVFRKAAKVSFSCNIIANYNVDFENRLAE